MSRAHPSIPSWSALLAWCSLFAALAPASSRAAAPKPRTYIVQPGDSIWSIAEEFYGHGNKYRIIYENNKFIGEPPFILKPGQVLTLPPGQVSPEAQVEWTRREVKAKPPKSIDWLRANNKMNLWKLYQVSTGGDSAVHIVFEDQSDLRMGEEALLVIYSGSSKTAKREQQKTQVLLKEGTVRGGLAALDGPAPTGQPGSTTPPAAAKPMVVETPSGVIELMSTLAQVQADATAAVVSVYEGQAAVKAEGAVVEVKKGQGTVVPKGKKPEAPTPLPPAPQWEDGVGEGILALVPEGGRASIEASWRRVEQAKTYRLELAHDVAFKQVAVSVEVPAETLRMNLDTIPAGRYFARVAARDKRRLEGMPSPALPVEVIAVASSRRMAAGADGVPEVIALTRLGLGEAGAGVEWALGEEAFVPGTEALRVSEPGRVTVRARRVGATSEARLEFRMVAVTARFEVGPDAALGPELAVAGPRIDAGGEPVAVTMTLTDERGRPAPLPEVAVVAEPGGALVLTESGPGRYVATVPAPAPPGPEAVTLTARFLDGAVGSARLGVVRKRPDEPYRYAWQPALVAPAWEGRLGATARPQVEAVDRVGVFTQFAAEAGGDWLALALQAELALLDRLGVDARLTLFRPPLSRDLSQENELGDLTLGLRWVVPVSARLSLAPSLRARLPMATRAGSRAMTVEPGVFLQWRADRDLWLETRQALALAFELEGDGGLTSWVSDYAARYRLSGAWSLSATLEAGLVAGGHLGARGPGLALGAGGHYTSGRLRLGVALGFGLTEGARARSGEVSLGLSLEVGLGTP